MADTYNLKKITDLIAKTSASNADLFLVGDNGTSTLRRITFDNIVSTIRGKYGLNDLQRDIVGSGAYDLNNISDGWHQIDATSQPSNMPISVKTGIVFQCSNTSGNGSKYQLYAYSQGTQAWQRVYWYGTWSAWTRIDNSWQSLGTATGTTALNIPSGATDIMAVVQYNDTPTFFDFNIATGFLSASAQRTFTTGYYLNSTSYALAQIIATSTWIKLGAVYINGASFTSTSHLMVRYR